MNAMRSTDIATLRMIIEAPRAATPADLEFVQNIDGGLRDLFVL